MASGLRQQSIFDAKFKAMFETEDEKFKKLVECLEPLRENKVQVDSFTLSNLHSFCVTSGQMVKHVQVLTTIPYKDVRDSVLAKANSLGICPLNQQMNLRHVFDVCQWMKTKTGIEAVVEVQRSEKLRRRAAAKGRTVTESAMIRAFNTQFAEYSTELKKARAVLEKESDIGVSLRDKYWPVSAFDVATSVLNEEAVLDFCKKEGVKYGLCKYVEGLIERKKASFALREADNLRAVLKAIECFEVRDSSNCSVGEKRKGHGGETSSKRKK
ncbi:hypothetical protein V5N11_015961 [Cardamine amara subsp. amara]|uniref:Uncharacterized protein n=1 Tax=Cardamine amara subsp. amara TaxID=228776 RepID=A0ABD1ARG2_CARAN